MNKLLSANFVRLKKSKYLWIGMFCMFALSVFITLARYDDMKRYGFSYTIEESFFYYTMFIGIASSAFCSLYLGTEYSDGTIRNKLMVGHTRTAIYLSNLIICFLAGAFMIVSFVLPMIMIGIPCFGFFHIPIKNILFTFFASLMMLLALTSFFIIICMLIQNKAAAAVITILGMFALLFAATYVVSQLDQTETIHDYSLVNGEWQEGPEVPNPRYPTGIKRTIYELLLDILPTGQAIQYIASQAIRWQLPLYSFLIAIIITLGGILLFGRKDIK